MVRKAAQLEEASSDNEKEQEEENSAIHDTGDVGSASDIDSDKEYDRQLDSNIEQLDDNDGSPFENSSDIFDEYSLLDGNANIESQDE